MMPRYRAREPIYLNGENRLIDTDEEFASDETPGLAWISLEPPPIAPTPARKPANPAA